MNLKELVEDVLSAQQRSLQWLASQMDRTSEGLRLGLISGSIKYNDIVKMVDILDVPVAQLFPQRRYKENDSTSFVSEPETPYKVAVESYKEQIELLKGTIKDKEKIIELLSK